MATMTSLTCNHGDLFLSHPIRSYSGHETLTLCLQQRIFPYILKDLIQANIVLQRMNSIRFRYFLPLQNVTFSRNCELAL